MLASFAGSTDYTSASSQRHIFDQFHHHDRFRIVGLRRLRRCGRPVGRRGRRYRLEHVNYRRHRGLVCAEPEHHDARLSGQHGRTHVSRICKPRPGSASGGTSYLTAGRRLDTTTAFAPYDVSGTQQIGAAGTTLWFSVLVDRQTPVGAGQTPTSVDFSNNSVEWNDNTRQFGVGYYGSSSDSGGVGYWSLLVGGTVLRSNVPISVGQTSLLVLQMNFSTTGDTFSLYVNPTSLGSSAPTAASATDRQ